MSSAHRSGPGSRPEESLPVGANHVSNRHQLSAEALIEEPIAFIQNKVCNPLQIGYAFVEEVHQTTRNRDENVRPFTQTPGKKVMSSGLAVGNSLSLFAPRQATNGPSSLDVQRPSEAIGLVLDLQRQFAGGRKHQGNRTLARGDRLLRANVDEAGHEEG